MPTLNIYKENDIPVYQMKRTNNYTLRMSQISFLNLRLGYGKG